MGFHQPVMALIFLLWCCPLRAHNCTKDACLEDLQKQRLKSLKDIILGQVDADTSFNSSKSMDDDLRGFFNSVLGDMVSKEDFDRSVTSTFYNAYDPSIGEDLSQLIARFDVENLSSKDLTAAVLSIAVDLPEHMGGAKDVKVQVYEKNEDGTLGEMVTSGVFAIRRNTKRLSVPLPVDIVQSWYTDSPISGLFVNAVVNGHNVALHPQQTNAPSDNMLLQLSVRPKGNRKRRSYANPVCSMDNQSKGCCLYDMIIEFDKIGWDWIVAPPRYNAYMCKGDCRYNAHHFNLAETGHSKIMRAAHRTGDQSLTDIGYCCHPTEYDYIKLIYVNRDGRVSIANVNGMIARKCGCS